MFAITVKTNYGGIFFNKIWTYFLLKKNQLHYFFAFNKYIIL
jgi:hypothetical protein